MSTSSGSSASKVIDVKAKRKAESSTSNSVSKSFKKRARPSDPSATHLEPPCNPTEQLEKQKQLDQLEVFGKAFMASFGLTDDDGGSAETSTKTKKNKKKAKRVTISQKSQQQDDTNHEIANVFLHADQDAEKSLEGDDIDNDESKGFDGHSDVSDQDCKTKPPLANAKASTSKPRTRPIETVVFGGESVTAVERPSKKGWKAFMSSKIEKINQEDKVTDASNMSKQEEEEEKQMESNDRLLSQLLSTTLFAPGSNASNGEKRNLSSSDTLARIMELSASETQRKGQAIGRGWGEDELKRRQMAKMPANIRTGMRRAAGEKREKERETAKELGTWHPSLKKAFGSQSTALERGNKQDPKKRQRGIGMGVGKFVGGQLKLSSEEIARVNKSSSGPKKRRK